MIDTHTCYTRECPVQVEQNIMCRTCWSKVPPLIQRRVNRTYRNRPQDGWRPWLEAVEDARAAVEGELNR